MLSTVTTAFLVHHLLGHVALAAHCIDGYDRTLNRQQGKRFWYRNDPVGLFRDLDLAQHQPLVCREGRDHVDRQADAVFYGGPPRRLAIDCNDALRRSGQRGNPGERGQDVAEMIMCRRAGLEGMEAARQIALLAAEKGDIGDSLGTGQHREQAQEQDLVERVSHLALLVRVFQILEIAQTVSSNAAQSAVAASMAAPSKRIEGSIDSALYRFATYSFTRLSWWGMDLIWPGGRGYMPLP